MHAEPRLGVQGLWQIKATYEPPKKKISKGVHRDSTSYEHTRAKEPNSGVTGGGKLLKLSRPSLRLPVPAWLSRWRLLKLQGGFFSHEEVGPPDPHPTASHGCAQNLAGDGTLQQITQGPRFQEFSSPSLWLSAAGEGEAPHKVV